MTEEWDKKRLIIFFCVVITVMVAVLINSNSQPKHQSNQTETGTTTTIQQCQETTTTIQQCEVCTDPIALQNQINDQAKQMSELRETIKDLRSYAYNGWSMANLTINETKEIFWNYSAVNYGVNSSDIDRLGRIRTLTLGMEHTFRNIMGR